MKLLFDVLVSEVGQIFKIALYVQIKTHFLYNILKSSFLVQLNHIKTIYSRIFYKFIEQFSKYFTSYS